MTKATTTACFLLRHADAGSRGVVDDDERSLSKKGRAQAERLATVHSTTAITTIISSPYTRCVQTVEPLARAMRVEVELDRALGEGSGPARAMAIIEAATGATVLCSHGDVIGDVLTLIARRGIPLDDDRLAKASMWKLTVTEGTIRSAHYVSPPT
ncbi:MAG: phosphoglycerate mutase family protein [Acidimicrobiia bacterium]